MELTEKAIDDFLNSGKEHVYEPTLILSLEQAKRLRDSGLIPKPEPRKCSWDLLGENLGITEPEANNGK